MTQGGDRGPGEVGGMSITLYHGDCLVEMDKIADNSVDSIVTDPPGGISFMGKRWDNLVDYKPKSERARQVWLVLEQLVTLGALQKWEAGFLLFTIDWATQALRVQKPGGMALVWSIPRTSDLTQMGLRMAGYEIRDCIAHLFGSGFPKSADISKMIDKAAGAEREVVGIKTRPDGTQRPNKAQWQYENAIDYGGGKGLYADAGALEKSNQTDLPATPAAQLWDGWGTALKPAREDWILAMKPRDGTFAHNAKTWGVAGLWIDGARVGMDSTIVHREHIGTKTGANGIYGPSKGRQTTGSAQGRFPANLILSHHPLCVRVGERQVKVHWSQPTRGGNAKNTIYEGGHKFDGQQIGYADPDGKETIAHYHCAALCPCGHIWATETLTACPECGCRKTSWACASRMLGEQSGERQGFKGFKPGAERQISRGKGGYHGNFPDALTSRGHADTGTASRFFQHCNWSDADVRFFYSGKASRAERNLGLEGMEKKQKVFNGQSGRSSAEMKGVEQKFTPLPQANIHPTCKPVALMRYLVRLTRTPAGGVVLDPFMGSGTTGVGCILENRSFIGIEQDAGHLAIAEARIRQAENEIVQLAFGD